MSINLLHCIVLQCRTNSLVNLTINEIRYGKLRPPPPLQKRMTNHKMVLRLSSEEKN